MPKKPSSDRKLMAFRLPSAVRRRLASLANECDGNQTSAVIWAINALKPERDTAPAVLKLDIPMDSFAVKVSQKKIAGRTHVVLEREKPKGLLGKRVPAVIEKAVQAKITNDVVRAVNRAPLFKRNGKLI